MIQAMTIDSDVKAVFTSMSSGGYDDIMEKVLADFFGDRELIFDTAAVNEAQIASYLLTRWVYIRQALEYQDGEYNPIENYLNNEHETTYFNSGEKKESVEKELKEKKVDDFYNIADQTAGITGEKKITREYNKDGNRVTEFAEGSRTEVSSVAPYDSDTFHNNSKTAKSMADGAKDVTTEKPYKDIESVSKYKDQHVENARTDEDRITKNAFQDVTTRDMTRRGNIGTMTASQMMTYDSEFWSKFDWIKEMAHGIAVTITRGVWML